MAVRSGYEVVRTIRITRTASQNRPQLPILPVPLPEFVPEFGPAPELVFMADGGATSRATQPPMPHAASTFSGGKNENFEKWTKEFERMASANNWPQNRYAAIMPACRRKVPVLF